MASKRVLARIVSLWADACWDTVLGPTNATEARREYVRLLIVAAPSRTDRELAVQFREVRDRVFSPGELRRLGIGGEDDDAE